MRNHGDSLGEEGGTGRLLELDTMTLRYGNVIVKSS